LLNKLKNLLTENDSSESVNNERALELASAALMIEVARSDFDLNNEEFLLIQSLLAQEFALAPEELKSLTDSALDKTENATCLFEFTKVINQHAASNQKLKIIIMLWEIAFSDSQLCKYEEALIRKLSDLLYVPHSDFIRARQLTSEAKNV
tara:strand:+ start:533 stop:985 length:453 start_codon:yes stop_codon:yes gene_type:complete